MICLNPIEASLDQIVETAGQPLPQTEVSIRSSNSNEVLPVGEVGEICARSYAVMIGYNDNPEATSAAIDKEGWLHTGDLAVMHPDGYIEIKDRAKDIIISGGENISSLEVEEVLYKHPKIMEAAVVARRLLHCFGRFRFYRVFRARGELVEGSAMDTLKLAACSASPSQGLV